MGFEGGVVVVVEIIDSDDGLTLVKKEFCGFGPDESGSTSD